MKLHSNRDRPFHFGPHALEGLPRGSGSLTGGEMPGDRDPAGPEAIAHCTGEYARLFTQFLDGLPARGRAAIPDDPHLRANNLKASAYFLDAELCGVCQVGIDDWRGEPLPHAHAFLFVVQFGREPAPGQPGADWIRGSNVARTDMRVAELAVVLSGYIRALGYSARGHFAGDSRVDLARLAVRAGIAVGGAELRAPFLQRGFRVGAVTTDYALAPDSPLGWIEKAVSTENTSRPLHMGRYPMEKIRRVPKRGDFFKRAEAGDLGPIAKRERKRFPFKHPYAIGMQPLIQHMVPLQGSREKFPSTDRHADPKANADAIKALGYYLGADFVGICRAEPWMYYSHDEVEGKPIEAYHEYAVVMLIDQGFETMDGASGDDWISASQSMRAYMRGAEIAGVMAAHCRRLGYSSRSHSNAHSEVIHNPAILMAGLGEVSRIGDTILNPFIGPRSKSVVFTTDLPLEVDLPIDFGLQDFCGQCNKCARECPCNAIAFGPKIMFNGYEIWKADVDKCTKYRVTQTKGSACGRCMKMCPWNREDTLEGLALNFLAIELPESRPWLIRHDDEVGAGTRNLVKRWWFDLEIIDGVAVTPPNGTNERDLSLGRDLKLQHTQRIAIFPPALQPRGGTTVGETVPVDRAAGMQANAAAERPDEARARVKK
jgi:ferredoxin